MPATFDHRSQFHFHFTPDAARPGWSYVILNHVKIGVFGPMSAPPQETSYRACNMTGFILGTFTGKDAQSDALACLMRLPVDD